MNLDKLIASKHHNPMDFDPNDTSLFDGNKKDAAKKLEQITKEIGEQQELLYGEYKHRVLIVLQAMDTAGKDGTILKAFHGFNPQGVKVTPFKAPTKIELDHDYFWRIHQHTPAKGEIAIFNRSYYEDVLVVRVHQLVPESVWSKRYDHIRHFEQMLVDEGVTVLKFFLNISKQEQQERIKARLQDPDKNWKFSEADMKERKYWDDYMKAYEAAISKTSTKDAPWYIIPANHKWFRNLAVAKITLDTLKGLKMFYPKKEIVLDEADKKELYAKK